MADENETSPTINGAKTPATAPEPKKQRAPRQKKAAEAAAPVPPAATVKSPRKKRGAPPVEATLAADGKPVVSESKPGKGRKGVARPKATKTAATVVGSALDEMADLIALETENKRLRQALSEKLRAENADLRKKLGQA
jgi:hypothetical protein